MSMLTPLGVGGRKSQRRPARRPGRGRGRRVAAVLGVVVLVVAAAGAFAWWYADQPAQEAPVTAQPVCPEPEPAPVVVAPTRVTVNVYNATERRGLAATVARQLNKRGFKVGEVANDPLDRKVTGVAEVRSSKTGAAAARTVSAQVVRAVALPDLRKNASVDLVLGAGFRTLQPVAAANAALHPTPAPPPPGCPATTG